MPAVVAKAFRFKKDKPVLQPVWALKGQAIRCANGHHICDWKRTVRKLDEMEPEKDFENWSQPEPEKGTIPNCTICGDPWLFQMMGY